MDVLLAGLVGLVIGVLLMFFMMHGKHDNQSAAEVEKKLKDYQDKVEGHFAQTADLIDNLTDSYKKVFEHLSESAEDLLDDEQIQRQIINRKHREVTLSYLSHNDESEDRDEKQHNQPDPWAG